MENPSTGESGLPLGTSSPIWAPLEGDAALPPSAGRPRTCSAQDAFEGNTVAGPLQQEQGGWGSSAGGQGGWGYAGGQGGWGSSAGGTGRVGVICKGDGGGQGRWRWGSLALYLSLSGRAQWGPPGQLGPCLESGGPEERRGQTGPRASGLQKLCAEAQERGRGTAMQGHAGRPPLVLATRE